MVFLISSLLGGTAALIGGVAYFTTRASIEELTDTLLQQTNDTVRQRMESYFGQAAPALDFVERTLTFQPDAMDRWREVGLELALFLDSQLDLAWIYFAEAETGNLLGATRDDDGRLLISFSHVDAERVPQNLEVLEDGELIPFTGPAAPLEPYDARTRPWFKAGAETSANTVVWTKPYQFLGSPARGVTAALPRYDEDGELIHVIGADLILSDTAEFLDSIEVGKSGAAFILMEDGKFLSREEDRRGQNLSTLRAALMSELDKSPDMPDPEEALRLKFGYEGNDYLALIQPTRQGRSFTAVILPESDYLAQVWRNAGITVIIAGVILVIAAILGVMFSRRVTEPLAAISEELESIGKLNFREEGLYFRSSIREIALFSDSLGKMKLSLRSFARYVPKKLVRAMLLRGDEAQLGGRIQSVTVQFSDLVDFTRLSEGMPADELFEELQVFLETIAKHQLAHGGVTSSFTGDGSLALFNAPEKLENHEKHAVEAALDCLAELRELNSERRKIGKPELHARIGINTAEVLLGNLGTRERFAYTAVGDGVNLASRLEGLGKLYGTEVLVGEACRNAAGEEFEWRKIDRIAVVGRKQATVIWEPLGRKGEVGEAWLKLRDAYERGLKHYFATEFDLASACFDEALRHLPDDCASTVMKERCSSFKEVELEANWDGTWVAPFK